MKTTKLEKGNWYMVRMSLRSEPEAAEYVGTCMGEAGFMTNSDAIHLLRTVDSEHVLREATNDEIAEMLACREAYYIGKGDYLDRIGYTPKA